MAGERTPGPTCQVERPVCVDDGTACVCASPFPGPLGMAGHTSNFYELQRPAALAPSAAAGHSEDSATSGSALPVGTGMGAVVRIPVPGTGGLFIELTPRGRVPAGGSTSTLFIQNAGGTQQLRLDYGYNKTTGGVDYHWNQKGTFDQFGIRNHTPAGPEGEALYRGARYFRYGGRILLVVGLAMDVYSIVMAKKKLRQVARVAAGWAGAWAGCEAIGAGGAALGTAAEPGGGTAVGGFLGCVVGGIGGYAGASWAAGKAYDWVEETFFEPVPEVSAAASSNR